AVRGKPAEALSTVDDLPYVESVNGIGVAADGSVYVAKSRSLSSYDPGSGFERCRSPRGLRACQGLMVLASGGPRTAALEGVVRVGETTASLEGKVQPRGAARYRFQVSDGGRWRDVGKPRYVSGPREVRVSTLARGLRPGALYRARLLLATRDRDGEEDRVASNIAFLVTVRPEAFATARPARAFAPLVQLHSDERSFPISASRFLQRATVKWKDGHCIGLINVATGRIASRKTPGAARVRPSRLGRAARPYRHRAFDRKCERRRPPVYSAIDLTRPFHRGRRAAGLPRDSGFYLDLLSDSYDGDPRFARRGEQRLLVGASAYYERRRAVVEGRPGIRLAYWLLYGSSRLPRVRGEPIGQHEGDWERIDVLARPGSRRHRWLPRAVRFHVGDRHRTLPWRDVLRQRSHPVVFAALGSHRPYPHAGRYELSARVAGRRARLLDETAACARCPQWETWKRLGPVRRQPWYGFGGGWGLAFRHHDTSGPLGPR
ncbi:MAG TPA: hypothetical protein VHF88_02430, partial [Thermoleophilaceae bacterium]|nr:hypothetical protein [Thermoleophilaceae bacterium]